VAANNVIELVLRLKDQITAPLSGVQNRIGKFGSAVAGLAGVATVGAAFAKVVRSTIEAENAVFKLDQAYKVFGKTVGVTRDNILAFSSATQRATIFGDEEITRAQTELLRFQAVTGETFKRARQVVVDFAAATGQSVESAAQTVGRAIERPEIALRRLRETGIVFSKSQEDTIRRLSETGQRAKASEVLLGELERRFKGTAEAARNTLGGALKGLSNAFSDLFEASAKTSSKAAEAINKLTATLSDPRVVQGLQTVASLLTDIAGLAVRAVAALGNLFSSGANNTTETRLNTLRAQLASIEKGYNEAEKARLRAEIARLENANPKGPQGRRRAAGPVAQVADSGSSGLSDDARAAPAALDDGLEVVVTATKRSLSAMEQFYQDLEERTRTSVEAQAAEYAKLEAQVQELVRAGRISQEQAAARVGEALDRILAPVQTTAKRVEVPLTAAQERLRQFADTIGAGIGNAISQGGLNGLTSLRDIVKQALRNIVADILTSGISKALREQFTAAAAGGGSGGFLGSVIKGFSTLFGFGKAGGGQSSGWTLVGETGPELVRAPIGSMKVYNRAQMASMMPRESNPITINMNPQVIVQGDMSERNQAAVLAAMEQTHARSMREVVRLLERNGLRRPV
jgi:predicted transcriptional regulator